MRQFDFNVWIKKWARQYKLPPVPVEIVNNIPVEWPWGIEQANAKYDWQAGKILIHSKMLGRVERNPNYFKYLKYVVAHEFGHYVSFSHRGFTAEDTAASIEQKVGEHSFAILQHEADVIAYELTGMQKIDFWEGGKYHSIVSSDK